MASREAIERAASEATEARRLLIALVGVLAAYEDGTRVVDTWRSPMSADSRYLGWLADNGYPLAEVEALAGPSKKGKRT